MSRWKNMSFHLVVYSADVPVISIFLKYILFPDRTDLLQKMKTQKTAPDKLQIAYLITRLSKLMENKIQE